jgi:KTSC domain
MKIREILREVAVQSSWISDLTHHRDIKQLTIRLNNGRAYVITNIPRSVYENWKNAPSKGRFYHRNVRGKYFVRRIK